jgi:Tol biopolymer transport system component
VVSKGEIIGAVWPDVAVMDNTLAQCLVEIRRALGDDSQQLIRTVAKRGYLFTLPLTMPVVELTCPIASSEHERRPLPVPLEAKTGKTQKRRVIVSMFAFLAVAGAAVLLGSFAPRVWRAPESSEPFHAIPLNSLPGVQRYPSFSPDGNHLAFTWTGPKQDNKDVYIQQIGSGSPLQRTSDPRIDYNPVWSPDGRWIAFLRRQWEAGSSELILVPPLVGPEHKLAEIHVRETYYITPPYLAWCPDSACVVVTDSPGAGKPAALFVSSLETHDKKQLTYPQFPAIGDTNPAISPDGSWIVFRRQGALENGELYGLRLGGNPPAGASSHPAGLAALGEPRSLTPATLNAAYPTWIPGGHEILFSAKDGLWRLSLRGENMPARLPFWGEDGVMPVVSHFQSGRAPRLVYVRTFQDTNIWRVEVSAPGAPASAPAVAAISSTRMDSTPQISPDGRRVAFVSRRSGRGEIWLANPDGTSAIRLTSMDAVSGAPCWSPDGERIVFQSNPEGHFEVYAISSRGGKPQNLTSHPAVDIRPSFSRDGRWIYFASNRTGQLQIWKIPAPGGKAVQITNTSNGAFAAFESPDGAYLYYNQTMETPSPLWRQPVSGGVPIKVLEGVVRGAFSVIDGGIYYVDRPSGEGGLLYTDQPSGETRLRYFDLATRRTTTVAGDLGNVFLGLSASKDGRTILYSRVDSSLDDLMLVENFR